MLVMSMDGLMHQSKIIRRRQQLPDSHLNLEIIIRSQQLHDQGHRPRHPRSDVGTAGRIEDRPIHKVRVLGAEDEASGVQIHGVFHVDVAEHRGA